MFFVFCVYWFVVFYNRIGRFIDMEFDFNQCVDMFFEDSLLGKLLNNLYIVMVFCIDLLLSDFWVVDMFVIFYCLMFYLVLNGVVEFYFDDLFCIL